MTYLQRTPKPTPQILVQLWSWLAYLQEVGQEMTQMSLYNGKQKCSSYILWNSIQTIQQ